MSTIGPKGTGTQWEFICASMDFIVCYNAENILVAPLYSFFNLHNNRGIFYLFIHLVFRVNQVLTLVLISWITFGTSPFYLIFFMCKIKKIIVLTS